MANETVYEVNFDGLVGPTHHYAGLSEGNIASTTNALSQANPQAAALQGLAKMRFLHQLGLKQALLPPHQRPNLNLLSQLGFRGSPAQQLQNVFKQQPQLLSACFSASSMWTANAATVSASLDTYDGRVHFTAANLISNLHRHQEADFSQQLLQKLFANEAHFAHHAILPRTLITGDEGAANFSRICPKHNQMGLSFFVYGKQALAGPQHALTPHKFIARQTLEASMAIARAHQLPPEHVVYAQQNPKAIDQGVFHNDVIATANEYVVLVHEQAYVNQLDVYSALRKKAGFDLQIIEVPEAQISVKDAVNSYLFNSQMVTLTNGKMAFIAPKECEEMAHVKQFIDEMRTNPQLPIQDVHYLDLKQSMRNGGGPACLRLRVPLTETEFSQMHQGTLVNDMLLDELEVWVKTHYRTQLHTNDLVDPQLVDQCYRALDELSHILKLGSIYPFQQEIGS